MKTLIPIYNETIFNSWRAELVLVYVLFNVGRLSFAVGAGGIVLSFLDDLSVSDESPYLAL